MARRVSSICGAYSPIKQVEPNPCLRFGNPAAVPSAVRLKSLVTPPGVTFCLCKMGRLTVCYCIIYRTRWPTLI